jgi:hypothetical protein
MVNGARPMVHGNDVVGQQKQKDPATQRENRTHDLLRVKQTS